MSKTNEELCSLAQNGDEKAMYELIDQNQKLIYSLLNKFKISLMEREDVYSCAKLGLIKAIQNYDNSKGTMFSTYAVPMILGEIKRYFRDNQALHVSRSFRKLYVRCLKKQEELESKYQRNVSLNEIAEILDVSFEDILMAYESHFNNLSLDAPIRNDDDNSLGDIISINDDEIKRDLNLALSTLNKKEQLIIRMRYFDGLTQQEVASRLFVSQVQVSRLEKMILEKLRIKM